MNEKARILAKRFGAFGDADTLHVYLDGVVMVLGGPADRHLSVRDFLKKMVGTTRKPGSTTCPCS